ncbi:unnamed protein product [Cyprideis torosa]|uniref:Uncharacterized protein n=1 Tax=Cyprideis torosa TaxID=163714 RepID=A0A7R8ZJM7_9CRUS|nr:unnamed protein product [Cyprideis torosa]CAG0887426.1 unnamed protein product [Cyprideis torosa]
MGETVRRCEEFFHQRLKTILGFSADEEVLAKILQAFSEAVSLLSNEISPVPTTLIEEAVVEVKDECSDEVEESKPDVSILNDDSEEPGRRRSQRFRRKQVDEFLDEPESLIKEEEVTASSAGKFSCETCGRRFKQKYSYRRHMVRDHQGGFENDPEFSKEVECNVCGQLFPFHRIYQHKKVHKEYPCKMCDKTLSSCEARKKHMALFHTEESKLVPCEVCGKRLAQPLMKRHLRDFHDPDFDFSCKLCAKTFKSKTAHYEHHRFYHSEGDKFVCPSCGKKFVTAARLRVHEETHKGPAKRNPHECDQCGKVFLSHYAFRKHMAKVHAGGLDQDPEFSKEVTCDVCGKVLPFHRLYQHKKTHKQYPCDVCGKTLSSREALKKHVVVVHTNDTNHIECEVCGKLLREISYRAHMKEYHDPEMSFQCTICSKELKCKQTLSKHMRAFHGGGGDYVCTICGKKFLAPSKLQDHEESHSDNKRHICKSCGKAYKYKAQLSRHMKLDHEGKNPYKCTRCPKVYRTSQRLKDHMNQHLGIKPNICAICQEAFVTSSSLESHRKTKHRSSERLS